MRQSRGFTMIELMLAVAVVAILMAIALPSYTSYLQRSKVPVALDGLSSLSTRMEQCYQDTGTYTGCAACNGSIPTAANFTLACTVADSGSSYAASATGSGSMSGYTYTIDSSGNRATTAHPNGSNTTCWTTRGSTCDT
jgi:type IV pilus assembly protein PilE